MRMRLAYKLALLTLLVAGGAVVMLAWLASTNASRLLEQEALVRLKENVNQGSIAFERSFETVKGDLSLLKHTPALGGVIRAIQGGGYDDQLNETRTGWEHRLQEVFRTVMQQRSYYSQVRLIGLQEGGRELVRLDRVGGSIEVVPAERLQQKGQRPYLQQAAMLAEEAIYFSEVTLNRERGRIVVPWEPMLRLATPVFDPQSGAVFGVLVLNIHFDRFTRPLRQKVLEDSFYLLANGRGEYLIHPQSEKRFSFEIEEREESLLLDYPQMDLQAELEHWRERDELDHEHSSTRQLKANALGFEAFIWDENNGYKVLGSLSDSKMFSVANAVNSDGSIVAGTSEGDNGMEAFKWTSSEGMIGLGDLPGGEYFSSALDVSNDGDKIAGFSSVGTDIYEAFKWTSEEGMTGLGRPSASESSLAMSISGDGNVVVGAMGDLESKNLNAFRWDLVNGMQKVTSWLTTTGASVPSALSLDIATSTNEDGSVVGGMSDGSAWLAFSGRGVVFPDTYTPTLVTPKISSQASFQLLDLSLDGSHHLPLKTMLKSKDKCFWANGDWSDKETKNTYSKLFEIGSCLDIDSDIRVGLGLGKSMSKKSIANEISSKIDGKYLYSEVGTTPLDNKDVVFSLSAFIGSWNSDITRYYLNSSIYDSSIGTPDISMTGFKVRADYMDLFNINGFSISPSIGLTRSNIKTNAYLETGGGFPVKFDKQTQFRTVAKVGLRGEKDIQNVGRLRVMVDRSHEVSRSNSNITGSIPGWMAFDIENNSSDNDSTNIALELDRRIDESSLISTMFSFKSNDTGWDNLTTISYKYGF